MTETSDREKSAFSTSRLEPSRELIQIPQVLESILRVLQIANHPSVIKTTFAVLGAALGELEENVAGDNAHAFYDKNSNVLNRNVDAICSQRDWILWLCDMYLTFQRRCRHGTLNDGFDSRENNVTSMSESESSIGGGYDSEDSVELRDVSPTGTSRKTFPRDRGRSLSPTSAFRRGRQESDAEKPKNASNNTFESNFPTVYERSTPIVIPSSATSIYLSTKANMLEAYLEPLFSFAQVVFLHELRSKPQTTRKFNDIINRIPIDNPEARQFQMNLLFDVLDAAAVESFVDPDKSMNVLRNVSTLLEQAAEKVDIEIEFCVRAVDTMDSLSYNCPTVLRAKIKETSLPEMRLLYVTRVLIDTTADIETKAASIRDIHGSIVSMVTSQDGKSLQDAQVVTILLGMWAEAADEIERNTELIEQCNSPTKDMGPTRSRSLENSTLTGFETKGTSLAALESAAAMEAEASLITRQEAIDKVATMTEIQLVTLELLQDIINASQECRKYVYKVFINLEAAVATLEKHKGLISMTSIPNGFHRSDIFLAGICNRYSEDNVTMNDLLSLNLFSGDTMFGEHKAGNEFIASSKESSSPDGTAETTLRNHQSPSGGVIESLHSSQSWWGSWVGSATTTSNPVVSNPTSPLLSMISNNSDDILPLLNLPSVTEDIGTSVFETRSKGASSGGLLFQIVSPGSSIIAVESIANNTVFIGWYSKFSNRYLLNLLCTSYC